MILRKPYAFLIKYFKIIHIVLTLLMIYVVLRMNNILSFIGDYINNVAIIANGPSLVNFSLYLALFLIIGICLALFFLMRYKKKPKLLYIITIAVYVVMFILCAVLMGAFSNLSYEIIDSQTIRLYRDVVRVAIYGEYVMIAVMVIRALGFDIKKFEFESDIEKMNIDVSDNEEFELVVGVDTDKLKQKGRRQLRELKYYVKENKIFVSVIVGVVAVIAVVSILANTLIFNRVYRENQNVKTTYFTMNIKDSYITKLDYSENDVGYNNTSYLIIKVDITGLYDMNYRLTTNEFILDAGGETILPTLKYYEYFTDLGTGYRNQKIEYNETNTYMLVYNVSDSLINKSLVIRYEQSMTNIHKIRLTPTNLDSDSTVSTSNLGETLNYKDTTIGEGSITVSEYEFTRTFTYNNNVTTAGYNKTFLRLPITSTYNTSNLVKYFLNIKYTKNGQEQTATYTNKTPSNVTDTLYLEVSQNITDADSIWLEFDIRDKVYRYNLK